MLLVDLETGLGKIRLNTRIALFGRNVHILYGFEITENWSFLNHYHLLMRTTHPNLSKAMQWLGFTYQDVTCNLTGCVFNPEAPADRRLKAHRCMEYRSQHEKPASGVRRE